MDFGIYIPSYCRAGNVSTVGILKSAIIVIPEKQYKDYRKYYSKSQLMAVPDKMDGSIARKRNAILDIAPHDYQIQVDDDLQRVFDIFSRSNLSENDILCMADDAFTMCDELGAYFWGFNWSTQPLHVNPCRPFTTNKPFWSWLGIVRSEMRFDQKLERLEDTDFWLQNIYRYGKTFRYNFVHAKFLQKAMNQAGGIKTKKDSPGDIDYIMRKWPKGCLRTDLKGELRLPKSPFPDI